MEAGSGRSFAMKASLRGKIMGGYVIITALALVVGMWSAYNYVRFSGQLNAMMVQNYRSVVAASHLVAALERQDSAALLLLLGDRQAEALFERARVDFLGWLARARDNVTLPGEGEVVARIQSRYLDYSAALAAVAARVREGTLSADAISSVYRQEVLPRFDAAREACWELFALNDGAMRQVQDRMTAASHRAAWSTLLVGVVALVLAVVLGFTVSEVIARPVRRLAESARRVGEGHLDETIPAAGDDEVGLLASEFNAMVEKLREVRASDVARLAASQRKLQAVMEAIGDGMVVTDTALRIESVNPVAREVLGWRGEDVLGRPFAEVVRDARLVELVEREVSPGPGGTTPAAGQAGSPGGEAGPAREGADSAAGGWPGGAGKGPAGGEGGAVLVEHWRDGVRRFYLAEASAVRHRGEVLGVVLLLRDVTAIEEAERSRSQFMSAISHELRTPLASLTMGIGLLAESKALRGCRREAELVDILKEDSRRLARLVDELFEISRLQSGQLPLSFARVGVADMIEAATLPFLAQAEAQKVELRREVPADLPPVRADREKVIWVISNLVSNALRYTPAGGKVTVSAELHGGRVYVSVADTGIGIPREKQDVIFEPYVQLEDRARGGAGLGLAIARDIVRAHGGRLFVESEPGKGSKFTFSLPVEP